MTGFADQAVEFELLASPGEVWTIQRAATVTGPWEKLETLTIKGDGSAAFTDRRPIPGEAFYRAIR